MPLVATRGAASAQGFGEFAVTSTPTYIEDVFSCFLYTGTGAAQTITNNIDLSTKGGLTWIKGRSGATGHRLTDTARGVTISLASNSTAAEATETTGLTAFGTTGFTIGADADYNTSAATYASWTFREQPKFFDVVTYTGTGSNTTIAHNLGSVPGSIIVKRTDTTADWAVYHRSLANTQYLVLNTTAAAATGATWWNSTTPTSSVFSVGTNASVNASGGTYVAYIFAHNAGGFGLTGTDNVISCGSFTTDGSGNASVNLGYEPQFWLYKPNLAARYWQIYDVMRGWSQTYIANLAPNRSDAEGGGTATLFYPTATGFDCVGSALDPSTEHIYIAIRRGPMKVPTLGTSVFSPTFTSVSTSPLTVTTNFPVDLTISRWTTVFDNYVIDRLRGASPTSDQYLFTNTTDAENTITGLSMQSNTAVIDSGFLSGGSNPKIYWNFRRAPGFFDEVCYTGDGNDNRQVTHNLGVAPELIICKSRSAAWPWWVGGSVLDSTRNGMYLNETSAKQTNADAFSTNGTAFTSSYFLVSSVSAYPPNANTYTQIAYLFATCAGVSKVGSYTGTGATQTINCGFGAGGSRFVLIKRTNSTGDWYVWDSARGMTSGTDPSLLLNSTAAEVNANSVYAISTGFQIVSTAAGINASAGTYIFLSVA